MTLPNRNDLVDEAKAQTGLSDFGNPWFFGHIDVLIPSLNEEARLSEAGIFGAQHMIVSSLVKRLRHIELLKKHPEILEEEVSVTAVLTGLPRTGSTMLHRMLAAAPQLTGVRWYETQNYVPLDGETRDDPTPRLETAQDVLTYMLDALPDLMSIHPMSIEQPDEEVIILGQLFSSSMIESTYFVPSYAKWLSKQDSTQAYADLNQILQSLQWQDKDRKGQSWVLKTPGHLMALDTVLEAFPDAKIVMTHRDPVSTLPSYCSMEASLYRLGSDDISPEMIGEYWQERLKLWLDKFMLVRAQETGDRFIDINYKELTMGAAQQGARVLEFAGIPMSAEIENGMTGWIEANKREHRAAHKYTLEDFGLNADDIRRQYSAYIAAFL